MNKNLSNQPDVANNGNGGVVVNILNKATSKANAYTNKQFSGVKSLFNAQFKGLSGLVNTKPNITKPINSVKSSVKKDFKLK